MGSLHSVSTGGVLIRDDKVLLVQVNYGPNKGQWMIPGGIVELGETMEEAVVREIIEETGLVLSPKRIIGLRNGIKQVNHKRESSIYVVFEMNYVSGTNQVLDNNEISNLEFFAIEEALSNPKVIELSKEFIKATIESDAGLIKKLKYISTNTKYKSYDVYSI